MPPVSGLFPEFDVPSTSNVVVPEAGPYDARMLVLPAFFALTRPVEVTEITFSLSLARTARLVKSESVPSLRRAVARSWRESPTLNSPPLALPPIVMVVTAGTDHRRRRYRSPLVMLERSGSRTSCRSPPSRSQMHAIVQPSFIGRIIICQPPHQSPSVVLRQPPTIPSTARTIARPVRRQLRHAGGRRRTPHQQSARSG